MAPNYMIQLVLQVGRCGRAQHSPKASCSMVFGPKALKTYTPPQLHGSGEWPAIRLLSSIYSPL